MNSSRFDPATYLAAPERSFWRWDEDGQDVSWVAGLTIAFRPEIETILRSAAPAGLPPLGLVFLVVAACRDSWSDSLARNENLERLTASLAGVELTDMKRLLDGLMTISRLSPEMRKPIEAKVGLIRFLFEMQRTCISADSANAVCDALSGARPAPYSIPQEGRTVHFPLAPSVPLLLQALDRFDEATFRLRLHTGLDQWVQAAEIELLPWEQARQLIADLLDDEEHYGLAQLARALMAVVHVPRPISAPEDLPMGGFTDIANRGPMDRLLVSELAHDDLTLAVRIALNEALYLRREVPPKTPSLSRSILIDAGIRMWGVPRIYATAAAMAFAATADHHAGSSIFRAEGNSIERIDLTTREGLVRHLGVVEPHAHPGAALPRFLNEARKVTTDSDCIVITSSDAVADRDFQQSLASLDGPQIYLATVASTGEFQLVRHGPHARKVVCDAKLALNKLLRPRSRPTLPLVDGQVDALPAIFRVASFPLRLALNRFNVEQCWVVPECGVFEIANDQRLLLWDNPGEGPRQVADYVPGKARVRWANPKLQANTAVAVLGEPTGMRLLKVDLSTDSVELIPLNIVGRHVSICGYGGVIYSLCNDEVSAYHAENGFHIRTANIQQFSPEKVSRGAAGGRFFQGESGAWYALAFDGCDVALQQVVNAEMQRKHRVIALIDAIGHEGPVGITAQGEMYYPEHRCVRECIAAVTLPITVEAISQCGDWIYVRSQATPPLARRFAACIQLSTGLVRHAWNSTMLDDVRIRPWVRPLGGHLHRRFVGLLIHEKIGMALVSRKNVCWKLTIIDGKLCLKPSNTSAADYRSSVRPFSTTLPNGDVGYELSLARLGNNSRAVLDSRGLLHLRTADPSIPEVSIVLTDGEVAGWCSDGRMWGAHYFVGDRANRDSLEIYETVLRRFQESVA